MANVTFTTLGSAGDLHPMLPIALELSRRGHRVQVAANPWFRGAVEREGLAFQPVGVHLGPEEYAAHPEILDPRQGGLVGIRHLMQRFLLPHLPRVVAELRDACRGTDLLLTHPAQLAAPMVAELEGRRWATLSVFPGNVPTRHSAPQGAILPDLRGSFGRVLNGASWGLARLVMRREFDPPLNGVRERFGLAPACDVFLLGGLAGERVLMLCPEAYCEAPPDWDPRIACTGYTCFDTPSGWTPPRELEDFLAAGAPPVLFSLGTSVAVDPQAFYEVAQSALDRVGERGLFLVGLERNRPVRRRTADAYFEYVPLSAVLPRCALAVHPGGFGTTAAAVVAGTPQLAVPRAFDQAYHGSRVVRLGIGCAIPWRRLTVASLEGALRDSLADTAMHARAHQLAARLGPADGVGVAVAAVEKVLSAAVSPGA
jgi:rhamnosyltransferase subunit B